MPKTEENRGRVQGLGVVGFRVGFGGPFKGSGLGTRTRKCR